MDQIFKHNQFLNDLSYKMKFSSYLPENNETVIKGFIFIVNKWFNQKIFQKYMYFSFHNDVQIYIDMLQKCLSRWWEKYSIMPFDDRPTYEKTELNVIIWCGLGWCWRIQTHGLTNPSSKIYLFAFWIFHKRMIL